MKEQNIKRRIAAIIPAYKATKTIGKVIQSIPEVVTDIYVIDDACPQQVGKFVTETIQDNRLHVITHQNNLGVGGAVISGYRRALSDGCDIMVKIDSDGQMDPALLPQFIQPIIDGRADYTKGNRFHNLDNIHVMPKIRLLGNACLSFLTKFSSGYWKIFDPTNGYTAIHHTALSHLNLNKVSNRYFFESDILFHLYLARAVVLDIPMHAQYGDEESQLSPLKVFPEFMLKHFKNSGKRLFYTYFLRDFNMASFELIFGLLSLSFGTIYGLNKWIGAPEGVSATSGQVMIAALPIIVGTQLLLSFLNFDTQNSPVQPLVLQKNNKSN